MHLKERLRSILPFYKQYKRYLKTRVPAHYVEFLKYKLGLTKRSWPASKTCLIANEQNIHIGINCYIGRPGAYLQGIGGIYFGNYVRLAPNVGILTSNHDLYDQNKYTIKPIKIGDYSWLGMNSVILPGVELGIRTIVGAGAVVTKSFPEGFCVLAGNPAKVIKRLDPEKFVPWHYEEEFYGFVPKKDKIK